MILVEKKNAALKNIITYLLLSVLTFLAFGSILGNDFILYDDPGYVTDNNHVLQGLTPDSIKWAFCTTFIGNWIPVTWLTHMLDVEIYGVNPRGHHLNNLILHTINTFLIFAIFQSTTKRYWVSLLTATFFAIHPLRVESVAWVSERKDVLSLFFGLLACLTYILFTKQSRGYKRIFLYILTAVLLVLGLMSKAMLVTWPFLFLVLDFWPLKRFRHISFLRIDNTASPAKDHLLLIEKIPFLCLAIIFSVVAFYAQQQNHAVHTFESSPLNLRCANVLVSYSRYLGKIFWPVNLSLLYPLNLEILATPKVILSSFVLVAISAVSIIWKNKYPWFLTGWLWFIGTLVPVIGFVQIGSQSIANRYTYLPSIGISLIVAFALIEFARKGKVFSIMVITLLACVLPSLLLLTWIQCAYWKNSITIFWQATQATDNNYIMEMNYAYALTQTGHYTEAFSQYQKASRIKPESAEPFLKCGIVRLQQKQYQQALYLFEKALSKREGIQVSEVYNNMGIAYSRLKDYSKGIDCFKKAIKENPNCPETFKNLALSLLKDQKRGEAKKYGEKGLSLAIEENDTELVNWFSNFLQDLKTEE